ncbi:MAG: YqiA/YcfP family alpha/beta fold hydrolase [Comamonadaceae bacterium]
MSAHQPITHLLYLHGFRSSPKSNKARRMAELLASRHPAVIWWCPQLPASPRQAMQEVMQGIADWPQHSMAVVGSSLGGFYASWVAQQTHCKAVVLNPAVNPARDLAQYIGEHSLWHDPAEHFFFREEFVQQLRDLTLPELSYPERCLAIIAKGDELLDWREMQAHYAAGPIRLVEGSDHALSDFEAHLPALLAFLGLD